MADGRAAEIERAARALVVADHLGNAAQGPLEIGLADRERRQKLDHRQIVARDLGQDALALQQRDHDQPAEQPPGSPGRTQSWTKALAGANRNRGSWRPRSAPVPGGSGPSLRPAGRARTLASHESCIPARIADIYCDRLSTILA
jgi:hypothetical protein